MNIALLLDLDETLIEEQSAAAAAFDATAAFAETVDHRLANPVGPVAAARAHARQLWSSAPTSDYCRGKPDASIFRYALSRLAEPHEQAVMLGDSLDRDIDGALSAGLQAIWVNRLGHPRPCERREGVEVSTLGEAVVALDSLCVTRL